MLNKKEQPNDDQLMKMSLGLVPLPSCTFEHDISVSDKYQRFSSELLRLSLAGIGGIGLLVLNKSPMGDLRFFVILALVSFGLASAFALIHLFAGADSKAYHLKYLRLELLIGVNAINAIPHERSFSKCFSMYTAGEYSRKELSKVIRAAAERDVRNFLLNLSSKFLFWSAILLWLGAMFLTFTFLGMLF